MVAQSIESSTEQSMAVASEHGLLISSIAARPNMVSLSISSKAQPVMLMMCWLVSSSRK